VFHSYLEDIEQAEQAEVQQYLDFNFREQQAAALQLDQSHVLIGGAPSQDHTITSPNHAIFITSPNIIQPPNPQSTPSRAPH
jgi:hypothetical protein